MNFKGGLVFENLISNLFANYSIKSLPILFDNQSLKIATSYQLFQIVDIVSYKALKIKFLGKFFWKNLKKKKG